MYLQWLTCGSQPFHHLNSWTAFLFIQYRHHRVSGMGHHSTEHASWGQTSQLISIYIIPCKLEPALFTEKYHAKRYASKHVSKGLTTYQYNQQQRSPPAAQVWSTHCVVLVLCTCTASPRFARNRQTSSWCRGSASATRDKHLYRTCTDSNTHN